DTSPVHRRRRREPGSRSASVVATPIGDDVDVLAYDETLRDELVALREKRVDPLGDVDDDDDDRKVLRQAEDPRGVDRAGGAETLDPAQHGRTGEAGSVRPFHDLRVERAMVVLVGLADVDRQPLAGAFELHHASILRGHSRAATIPR